MRDHFTIILYKAPKYYELFKTYIIYNGLRHLKIELKQRNFNRI